MKKITLVQFCPGAYESQEIHIDSDNWEEEWREIFGERVAQDPDITLKRIQQFLDSLNELDDKIAEKGFWPKVIQFMIENQGFSMSSDTWAIIYFLQECEPMCFKFRVARTIHGDIEEMQISDNELDDLINGKTKIEPKSWKNDPNEKDWDLELIIMFDQEEIENHEEYNRFPAGVIKDLTDTPDYALDVFLLTKTSLKNIRKILQKLNIEINEL